MKNILKKNGSIEPFSLEKLKKRLQDHIEGLQVNLNAILTEINNVILPETSAADIDLLLEKQISQMALIHPDYSILAGRIAMSIIHKQTPKTFKEHLEINNLSCTIHEKYAKWADKIENLIDYSKDFNFNYFAVSTLKKSYLLKENTPKKGKSQKITERPQQMYMRVALELGDTWEEVKTYYEKISDKWISPATPILFNAGTKYPTMISCNLTALQDDSLEGQLETLRDVSISSASAAGIGLSIDNLRSEQSYISRTGGKANGVIKYAKQIECAMRSYNQGGKRTGSCALYLSCWHKDILNFLELTLPHGVEECRTRDLFTAVNIRDNFMRAVQANTDYHVFCPNDLKQHGFKPFHSLTTEEFEYEYNKAVAMDLGVRIPAQELFSAILKSQIKSGKPYLLFIDTVNKKSPQVPAWGAIRQSNLCIEIVQYSDEENTAQCVLSSIPVQNFVKIVGDVATYDFEGLYEIAYLTTKMLNKVIDKNKYPTERAKRAAFDQRAIAIGIQGLADAFAMMDYSFGCENSKRLNKDISETIYLAALTASNDLAKEFGTHNRFEKTGYGKGEFQWEYWNVPATDLKYADKWEALRKSMVQYGLRNSLVTGYMPTASSANILGSFECFEPITGNIFLRECLCGEMLITNKYLVEDLTKLGLWNSRLANEIIKNEGSIQQINFEKFLDKSLFDEESYDKILKRIAHLKEKYRVIWEISMRTIIDMAADRGAFIDQSQSMNLSVNTPSYSKMTSMLFYAWQKGLKTGVYYTRTASQLKENLKLAGVNSNNDMESKMRASSTFANCESCSA